MTFRLTKVSKTSRTVKIALYRESYCCEVLERDHGLTCLRIQNRQKIVAYASVFLLPELCLGILQFPNDLRQSLLACPAVARHSETTFENGYNCANRCRHLRAMATRRGAPTSRLSRSERASCSFAGMLTESARNIFHGFFDFRIREYYGRLAIFDKLAQVHKSRII